MRSASFCGVFKTFCSNARSRCGVDSFDVGRRSAFDLPLALSAFLSGFLVRVVAFLRERGGNEGQSYPDRGADMPCPLGRCVLEGKTTLAVLV